MKIIICYSQIINVILLVLVVITQIALAVHAKVALLTVRVVWMEKHALYVIVATFYILQIINVIILAQTIFLMILVISQTNAQIVLIIV
jgi:hypothetical protein